MTTSSDAALSDARASSPESGTIPYAPSALTRFYASVERLPGNGWWIYPLSFVALAAYTTVVLWIMGREPVGSFSTEGIIGCAYGPYIIGVGHYITRVAGRAIAEFRPASGLGDADYLRRRYELTVLPAGRVWLAFAAGALVGVGSILSASAAGISTIGGTRLAALLAFGPASIFGYGMTVVVIYQTARQLREVERLHHEATAIDPFDTAPIYAFSRLTVQIGATFILAAYYALFVDPGFQAGNTISLAVIAVSISVAVASFIVPLWGIHERLVAEKASLVRGANLRAQALQEELYRRVDGANLPGVKDVTDALGGIHATREQIAKLPTWPWPPQLLRGFISAIILPVIVYMITRYVATGIH